MRGEAHHFRPVTREAPMMFSLVLLTTLAQPAPELVAPSGLPPESAVAIIDGEGKLRITQVNYPGYTLGPAPHETEATVLVKRGDEKVTVTVKVTSLVLTTTEFPANVVDAYTVDGKAITPQDLATMLAKERTVLVSRNGKKVDPFHLELYKVGTIVLAPPPGRPAPSFNEGYAPIEGPPLPMSDKSDEPRRDK
jgi:hypothetical protein